MRSSLPAVSAASPMVALGVFVAMVAAGAGCIGLERRVRGVVLYDRTEGCSDVPARTGASGASVILSCPGEDEPPRVVSEVGGRFVIDPGGALDAACVVIVEKDGYLTRRYGMDAICSHPLSEGQGCRAASVTAHLVPRPPPATAESATASGRGAPGAAASAPGEEGP